MRRYLVALATVILAAWLLGSWPASSMAEPGEPIRIAPGPGVDQDPLLALAADGRLVAAWIRRSAEADSASLHVASAPAWDAREVASLSVDALDRTALALAATRNEISLAWSQPATQTVGLWQQPLALGGRPTSTRVVMQGAPEVQPVLALDATGSLHLAWPGPDAITYADPQRGMTLTIPIESGPVIDALTLAVGPLGEAHLAWMSFDRSRNSRSLHYVHLASQTGVLSATVPVQVASQAASPRLMSDPHGHAHLVWRQDAALYYAQSAAWSDVVTLADGLAGDALFDAAVDSDGMVHTAWMQEEALWYASSHDWALSRRELQSVTDITGLTMAVDRADNAHVAWTAGADGGDGGLYYLAVHTFAPQLAVIYPTTDHVISEDSQARAESNLHSSEIERVEFYLQREKAPRERVDHGLMDLGLDTDGSDGWSVPLPIAGLLPMQRYRVVALGTELSGSVLRATGGWFSVQPERVPNVWLRSLNPGSVHGWGVLSALLRGVAGRSQRVDLFLVPLHCDLAPLLCSDQESGPSPARYLGRYELDARDPRKPQVMLYDSRTVPDGLYRAMAVLEDEQPGRLSAPTQVIHVDNGLAPEVRVNVPEASLLSSGVISATAEAQDLDGHVTQVDFFLERLYPVLGLEGDESLAVPYQLWLGRDDDGTDGWGVARPVQGAWLGGEWDLVATASDNGGLSATARSEEALLILGGREAWLQLERPLPGSHVSGNVQVRSRSTTDAQGIEKARAYLQQADGRLHDLGAMALSNRRWILDWDTLAFPDGQYHLALIATTSDGRSLLVSGDTFSIRNAGAHRFSGPSTGAVLQGVVLVSVEQDGPGDLDHVSFFYRDRAGALYVIDEDRSAQDGWAVLWNTRGALDGEYTLISHAVTVQGRVSQAEQPVVVRNLTPSIALADWPTGQPLSEDQPLRWRAEHPVGLPISVTIWYSPDNERHWMRLASGIPAGESYVWDTTVCPDSRQARLRLAASDGVHVAQVMSDPFVLNNINESPQVTVLAPRPGSIDVNRRIAWQAWDPDGDPLRISIDYRREGGDWQRLASDLLGNDSFMWESLPPPLGQTYDLRITATDPSEAKGVDNAEGITFPSGHPPTIQLLWPRRSMILPEEAYVLWRAIDEDGDPLEIDLYYSDNAGQAWLPLAEGLPNTGFFSWQVSFLPSGGQYRVRVVARDGHHSVAAESDDTFSIGECVYRLVSLTSPTPGERVSGLQLVRWAELTHDSQASVSLAMRRSGSTEWDTLVEGLNEGFYLWDTRQVDDGIYDLRISLGTGPCATSDTTLAPITVANGTNSPPHVELLAPQGGEVWFGLHAITWDAWDPDGDPITATLSVSLDGGPTWDRLATVDASLGRYLWDTHVYSAGRSYVVRIRVNDGQAVASDVSPGAVILGHQTSHPPHITLLSPGSDGRLSADGMLSWLADDADGDALSVDIALSQDGGLTYDTVARDLANLGEYSLADHLDSRRVYRVRVQARDDLYTTEVTSAPLAIGVPEGQRIELAIEAPQEGESWSGQQTIRWRAADPTRQSLSVTIESSSDGGLSWQPMAASLTGEDAYAWDTTQVPNGTYRVRITADNGRVMATETSGPFAIDNPGNRVLRFSLITPSEKATWSGLREIIWQVQDVEGLPSPDPVRVHLAYSLDRGATWRTIAQITTPSDRYVWDTTTIPNSNEVWIRAIARGQRFGTQAVSTRSLAIRNLLVPTVRLLVPRQGACWQGRQEIAWRSTRQMIGSVRVQLELSLDGGISWRPLVENLPPVGYHVWDSASVPNGSQVLLRALASDGRQSGLDTVWEPITVAGNPASPGLPLYLR
ncbi:MAG: hypothetical protein JXA74_10345 [Anaerolineae bacterium]|nr:hypothetical protein [Anaerolineae bacterium]